MQAPVSSWLQADHEQTSKRGNTQRHILNKGVTHRQVCKVWVGEQSGSSRQMVILQWGLVIVRDGQVVLRLAQEVIVQATMLVVMHGC